MARYKEYDYNQGKFIPVHFDKQILPGTFEHMERQNHRQRKITGIQGLNFTIYLIN